MAGGLGPGSVIGILGGGQLGRMLALAAARLGFRCAVYCPDERCPAAQVTDLHFAAAYDDDRALDAFAEAVDLVTYEFENIPLHAVEHLDGRLPVRPGLRPLTTTQDRLYEKDFLSALDRPVAAYRAVSSASDLAGAVEELGAPVIAKTRRLGYDGKGQARLLKPEDAAAAWASLSASDVLAERCIAFDREISVVLARGLDGRMIAYPPGENVHARGILRSTTVPATLEPDIAARALEHAEIIAEALDFVGILAVEMFAIDREGALFVNEIAPRVHNSGHWTIEGAVTCQFEQHIRAICGLPLGAADALGRVRMDNLIGRDIDRWRDILADPAAHFHHYGKAVARDGRKMGHVTRVWLD